MAAPNVAVEPFVADFVLQYTYKRSLGATMSAYFTALRDGRILGARTATGRVLSPACEYDPETGADILELVEVGPAGTVTSWTETTPGLAWALIQLDGADTATLHALHADSAALRTGLRVRPVWAESRTGQITDIAHFEALP